MSMAIAVVDKAAFSAFIVGETPIGDSHLTRTLSTAFCSVQFPRLGLISQVVGALISSKTIRIGAQEAI